MDDFIVPIGVAIAIAIAVLLVLFFGVFQEPRIIKQGYLVKVSYLPESLLDSGKTILEFKDGSTFPVDGITNTPRPGMIRITRKGIFDKIEPF